jgi:hypothetical protein
MALQKSSAKARYIRTLQNVAQQAVILCDGKTFSVDKSRLRQESFSLYWRVESQTQLGSCQVESSAPALDRRILSTAARVASTVGGSMFNYKKQESSGVSIPSDALALRLH